jgi:hypothetical protein
MFDMIYNTIKKKIRRSKGCWLWTGGVSSTGYGLIRIGAKRYKVHRLMYQVAQYDDPGKLLVRHTCDNRLCCNPQHLILGTHTDNINDMVTRGRHKCGRIKGGVKVSIQDKEMIKFHRQSGLSITALAARYGISRSYVDDIIHDRKPPKKCVTHST